MVANLMYNATEIARNLKTFQKRIFEGIYVLGGFIEKKLLIFFKKTLKVAKLL